MKLALVGRGIAHSKSENIYKSYYSDLDYDLIDVSPKQIPSLEDLFLKYDGVSITAPYKDHYFNQLKIEDDKVKELGIVNTIKKTGELYKGTLTDRDAFIDIFNKEYKNLVLNHDYKLNILGDGNMAKMILNYLNESSVKYNQYSRKKKSLDSLEFDDGDIVINTCGRDYQFSGEISKSTFFWDFNYNHSNSYLNSYCNYRDGFELLNLQAKYAVDFWSRK